MSDFIRAANITLSTGEKNVSAYFLSEKGKSNLELLGRQIELKDLEKRTGSLEKRMAVLATIFDKEITVYLLPYYERQFLRNMPPHPKSVRMWAIMQKIFEYEGFWIPIRPLIDKLEKEGKIEVRRGGWISLPVPIDPEKETDKK